MFTMPTSVTYRGREYTVEHDEDFWTKRTEDEFLAGKKRPSELNIDLILRTVRSWDLPARGGGVLPLTREALEDANIYLLDAVVEAMIKAVNPNPSTTSTS
jgi:hypothetical protein